jgi:hypothetical protein
MLERGLVAPAPFLTNRFKNLFHGPNLEYGTVRRFPMRCEVASESPSPGSRTAPRTSRTTRNRLAPHDTVQHRDEVASVDPERGHRHLAGGRATVVYTHLRVEFWNFATEWHTICARPFVQRMTAKMDLEACDV